jgi:SAM-dependent methyltransferase
MDNEEGTAAMATDTASRTGGTQETSGIPDPPEHLVIRTGGGLENGQGHLTVLQEQAGLEPDESVFEIGCGVGKTAIPLTGYLSDEGKYEGLDLDTESIEWARRHISASFPNFGFTYIDLYSGAYNDDGSIRAEELTFPYDDASFDLAYGFSLFTHILPAAFERYCSELKRVLKPDKGRLLGTFFFLTDENRRVLEAAVARDPNVGKGQAKLILDSDVGEYSVGVSAAPEGMVVYKESYVRSVLHRNGFLIAEPIVYGQWVEQAMGLGGRPQDTLLAYSRAADGRRA